MSKPSGNENLEEDLAHLKRMGITSIVSLLEVSESRELGLSEEGPMSTSLGIDFQQFPIVDRSIPTETNAFVTLVKESASAIQRGAQLVGHCRAGIGRSGIFTSAILIASGHTTEEATELVSSARGLSIPDTDEQLEWLHTNASSFAP